MKNLGKLVCALSVGCLVAATAGCADRTPTQVGNQASPTPLAAQVTLQGDGTYSGSTDHAAILKAAGRFVEGATSVAVKVEGVTGDSANRSSTYSGVLGTSDVRIDMDRFDGGKASALHVGTDVYLLGCEAFWKLVQGEKFDAQQANLGAEEFVLAKKDVHAAKRPPGMTSFIDYLSLSDPATYDKYSSSVKSVMFKDKPALVLSKTDGSEQELVVEAAAPYRPLQLTKVRTRQQSATPIRLTFDRWNDVPPVQRPTAR